MAPILFDRIPALGYALECTKRVKNFLVHLRLRLRFCRRQNTGYQLFGDRETLTISMWSTDGAGGTGEKYELLTQMERCNAQPACHPPL
jgi:hypothetical protein